MKFIRNILVSTRSNCFAVFGTFKDNRIGNIKFTRSGKIRKEIKNGRTIDIKRSMIRNNFLEQYKGIMMR
jgi:hypothetical protein